MEKPIYKRRMDIINSLPWGAQTRMTQILDVSLWHINKVLNGHLNAATETNKYIIILAEQIVTRAKQQHENK